MLPFPANGNITYDPTTNVITHSCDPGYTPSPTGQRMCQSNNQWSGTTVNCECMREKMRYDSGCVLTDFCSLYTVIMCPTLSNPENGQVLVKTHTVGGVATYNCNNGFTLTGAEQRMCVQNGVGGSWTAKQPTCGRLIAFFP